MCHELAKRLRNIVTLWTKLWPEGTKIS